MKYVKLTINYQNEVNDVLVSFLLTLNVSPPSSSASIAALSIYLFALWDLFYISIVFRFHGFKFHPFYRGLPRSRIFPRSGMHGG